MNHVQLAPRELTSAHHVLLCLSRELLFMVCYTRLYSFNPKDRLLSESAYARRLAIDK